MQESGHTQTDIDILYLTWNETKDKINGSLNSQAHVPVLVSDCVIVKCKAASLNWRYKN